MSITNNTSYPGSIAESIHKSHDMVFMVVSPITSLRWYDPDQVQRVRNLKRFRLSPDNSDSPSNVNKLRLVCRSSYLIKPAPLDHPLQSSSTRPEKQPLYSKIQG